MSDAYATLERRFTRLSALSDVIGILDWDTQTTMPPGAADARAEQTATLRVLRHELLTAPDIDDLLDRAAHELSADDPWRLANLREMRRRRVHATAVPPDLVEAESMAASKCERVWRTARAESDFAALRPHLEEVLRLQRAVADAKAAALGVAPYDALLDQYEPDGRAAEIDALFAELATFLPGLIEGALEAQARRPAPARPAGPFPAEAQRALGAELMRAVGFDFERGRLDVSLHPFCGGATDDVRLTTRYDEADFAGALMGVLHETGHALYEQNRPRAWRGQPVGEARGMVLHESQSLLVEMQACRSRAFLGWLAPRLREAFGGEGPAWDADELHRVATTVERGFIRVDADEATYPAHVVLRYRLERAMLAGDLAVGDLPGAWADGMRELLHVVPPDDRLGCLQDIHWPAGAWGYFPCYTLGAMAAAQLFRAAAAADPGIEPALAGGDFRPLVAWLAANVHGKGSAASTREILEQATGAPLGVAAFRAHLERRYLDA